MNKFFSIILICITALSYGQNIPNGNFEQWDTLDHHSLDDWYSYTNTVERTTDSKVGNYAIKLKNVYSETGNGSKAYLSNHTYSNQAKYNGFAMSGDPLSVVFWSKHDLAIGDTARMYMVFRDKGVYKGVVDFRMNGTTNGQFVKYDVPIRWSSARTPDSVWIYINSKIKSKIEGDGFIIFDDIHFEKIGERMPDFTNHSFENYHNIGLESPNDWRSVDRITYDRYRNFYTTRCVVKSSDDDVFLGNHSLIIKNYTSGSYTGSGYCFFGEENDDYYTPAFAFTDTFKYLQGYYKYQTDSSDTARVNFRTYDMSTRRSSNNIDLPPVEDWTFFSMPLTYSSNYTPDSASFIAYSTFKSTSRGRATSLYLDNLDLVLLPTPLNLSVASQEISANLYPNPCKDRINVESQYIFNSCTASDLFGRVTQLYISENIIDCSSLSPGLYILSLTDGHNHTQTVKIIKRYEGI